MQRNLLSFGLAGILVSMTCFAMSDMNSVLSDQSTNLEKELGRIRGLTPVLQPPDPGGGPGGKNKCLEFAPDGENMHWECLSPYDFSTIDNDCDFKGCSAGSCGTGIKWNNSYMHIWYATGYSSETAYVAHPTVCWRTVQCTAESISDELIC